MSKVYSIVMKVRLDCPTCHKKITKALCSVCICDLQTKNFDEKENTVTITGTFDPEKFMKKICRKVGKFILSYEVIEMNAKKEEKAAPKKEKAAKGEKDPASAAADDKKKTDDKKKGDDNKKDAAPKADDKALDPAPEKSAPKPAAAAAAAIETPIVTELYSVPAIGAPANWGYYGQYPYGYYSKPCYGVHERPSCSCGSGYGQNHYGQQSGFFSEEESTCRIM